VDFSDLFSRGCDAYEAGELESAIRFFQRVLDEFPDMGTAHFMVAEAYLTMGEPKLAHYHYSRAAEINSSNIAAWNGMGIASMELGDHNRAYDSFQKAADLDFGDPVPLFNLGKIAYDWGDYEGSEFDLSVAIENDPTFGLAYAARADARIQLGRKEDAREDLEIARALGVPDEIQGRLEYALEHWDAA
jgi:tetratricopeptide (TPR) repeat protein